jgi:hypothetical protein
MAVPMLVRGEYLRATTHTSKKGNEISTLRVLARSAEEAQPVTIRMLAEELPEALTRGAQVEVEVEVDADPGDDKRAYLSLWGRSLVVVTAELAALRQAATAATAAASA